MYKLQARFFNNSDRRGFEGEMNQFLATLNPDDVVDIKLTATETTVTVMAIYKA